MKFDSVRSLVLVLAAICVALSLAPMASVVQAESAGSKLPSDIIIVLGFGGSPIKVATPSPKILKRLQTTIPASFPSLCVVNNDGSVMIPDGKELCLTVDGSNLYVHFKIGSSNLLAPYLDRDGDSKQVLCIQLPGRRGTSSLSVTVEFNKLSLKCDADQAWLYASGQEQRAPFVFVQQDASTKVVTGTMTIPWSLLALKPPKTADKAVPMKIKFLAGDLYAFVTPRVEVLDGGSGAPQITVNYAPIVSFRSPTPMPSQAPNPLRLHDVGMDIIYQPNEFNQLWASFAQNDAVVDVDTNVKRIVSGALLPLPSPSAPPPAQILQTQPYFGYPTGTAPLQDNYVASPLGVAPFDLTKVPSLDMGAAYGYANTSASASLFYGLSQPYWYEAFAGQVTIPSPPPTATLRQPEVLQSPQALPPAVAQGALTSYVSPVNEAAAAQMPTQISFIDAITKTPAASPAVPSVTSVSGVAFNTTAYQDDCSTSTRHCSAIVQFTANAAYAPSAGYDANYWTAFAESATFTQSTNGPRFVQITETLAGQQSSSFFNPIAGDSTAYTPLTGPVGHATLMFGSGNDGVWTADFGAYRLANWFGDIATQEDWNVNVPFGRMFSIRGGAQTQSISSRIAALQQGIVGSYVKTFSVAPTGPRATPGPQPTIFTQNVEDLIASYKSPQRGHEPAFELDAGALYGSGPICAAVSPSPAMTYVTLPTRMATATPGPTFGCAPPSVKKYQFTGAAILGPFPKGGSLSGLQLGLVWASAQTYSAYGSTGGGPTSSNGTIAPGTITGFASYIGSCLTGQIAYSNVAYVANVSLPQQGSTLSGEVDAPLNLFDVGLGYFNDIATNTSAQNQRGAYVIFRLTQPFQTPVGCPARL